MKDLSIIAYFSSHTELLEKVAHLLKPADLFNMDFLGINLGAIPAWNLSVYINPGVGIHSFLLFLIPVLSALTSYISAKYSMQATPQTSGNQMQSSMQKNMLLMSPVMSGFISFTVPAGLGLYWIAGNVYQIVQQMFINIFVLKKRTDRKAQIENSGSELHQTDAP